MAQMEAELEKAEAEFRSCTKRLTGAKRGFEYAKVGAVVVMQWHYPAHSLPQVFAPCMHVLTHGLLLY